MKNIFKNGALILTALILSSPVLSQKIAIYESQWNSGPAGKNEEDLINRMRLHDKSQFLFLIANDGQNLYIDLIQADRAAIQKIMRFGMTTWINPEGKHKKTMGVEFPVKPEENGESGFRREKGGDRKDMMMAMLDRKNREMKLTGFEGKGSEKIIDPMKDPSFDGKIEMMEGGRLHISLVLPLDKLGRDSTGTFVNPLGLGFETGYLDLTRSGMSSSGGGQQSTGGGMHGGGGGMYGGGPPPSGGASGSTSAETSQQQPDLNELATPSKFWINQVKLAAAPPNN